MRRKHTAVLVALVVLVAVAVIGWTVYAVWMTPFVKQPQPRPGGSYHAPMALLSNGTRMDIVHPYECFASVLWVNTTSGGRLLGSFMITNASYVYVLTTQSGSSFNGGNGGCASSGNVSNPGQTTGPSSYDYATGLTTGGNLNVPLPTTTWGYELVILYNSTVSSSTTVSWTSTLQEVWPYPPG